jgi:hypothetical protein
MSWWHSTWLGTLLLLMQPELSGLPLGRSPPKATWSSEANKRMMGIMVK